MPRINRSHLSGFFEGGLSGNDRRAFEGLANARHRKWEFSARAWPQVQVTNGFLHPVGDRDGIPFQASEQKKPAPTEADAGD